MKKRNLNRWEEYIILLLRCLAIVFIVLAFAQPDLKSDQADFERKKYHYFVLDASASFGLENEEGILWDQEQEHVLDLLNKIPASSQIKVCTDRIPVRWMNKDQALRYIQEIKWGASYVLDADFFEALKQDVLREGIASESQWWWFTDGQIKSLNEDGADLPVHLLYYPNQGHQSNLAIKSVDFGAPIHKMNGLEVLNVHLENQGEGDATTSLVIQNQKQVLGQMEIRIPAKGAIDTSLVYKNDPSLKHHEIQLRISDGGYEADNIFYCSYACAPSITVYELKNTDKPTSFTYLFQDSIYQLKSDIMEQADYNAIQSADLLILNGVVQLPQSIKDLLKERRSNEKAIYFIPTADIEQANESLLSWSDFKFSRQENAQVFIQTPSKSHRFYQGVYVDAPQNGLGARVDVFYQADAFFTDENVILKSNANQCLMHQNQKTFFQYFPLNDSATNFMDHALFVTLALRISEESIFSQPVYYWSGQDLNYNLPENHPLTQKENVVFKQDSLELIAQLQKKGGSFNVYLPLAADINPGFYFLKSQDYTSEAIAINADRRELKTDMMDMDSLKASLLLSHYNILKSSSQQGFENDFEMEAMNELTIYTKISLILALIILLIEITLIKFWIR